MSRGIPQIAILAAIFLVLKLALAAFSIWGYEFRFLVDYVSQSRVANVPWIFFSRFLYDFWTGTLLDHEGALSFIRGTSSEASAALFWLSLIMKIPLVIADIVTGFIIYKILLRFKIQEYAVWGFIFWSLNPYTNIVTEMQGAIDIVPVALLMVGLYATMTRRNILSFVSMFAGTGLKFLPVILAPTLFRYRQKNFHAALPSVIGIILGAAAYVYWIMASGLNIQVAFFEYSPLTHQFSDFMPLPQWGRGGEISTIALSLTLFYFLFFEYWQRFEEITLIEIFFATMLLYVSFSNWYAPYFGWLVPLLVLTGMLRKTDRGIIVTYYVAALAYGLAAFDFTANGQSLFFFPIWQSWEASIAAFLRGIHDNPNISLIGLPILRSVLAALAVIYLVRSFLRNAPRLRELLAR